MSEREQPDIDRVREALREHDERIEEDTPPPEPPEEAAPPDEDDERRG